MSGLMQLEPTMPATPLGLESMAWLFKALSDPARLKIIIYLASDAVGCCGDGICGCDLEEVTGLSQPTISHHMKCLASADLVVAQKRGKWMYYSLKTQTFVAAQTYLQQCC
jgi:ArsR family transcriptional regulator, arsenate/arsenite/antimonite-responsive transcriptional repressor